MFNVPILYIVYNRPDETRKSFEVIRKLQPATLYISADGPNSNRKDDFIVTEKVRSIISEIDWKCELKTQFYSSNLGCRRAVETALDWFFKDETEGIIIEDDIIPNNAFFKFCEIMLERYRDDDKIFSINGCSIGYQNFKEAYGSTRYFNMWGWATWRRSHQLVKETWREYNVSVPLKMDKEIKKAVHLPVTPYWNEKWLLHWQNYFTNTYSGELDTWDLQWGYTCFKKNKFCIRPSQNYIVNIGFGEAATHHKFTESPICNLFYTADEYRDKLIVNPRVDDKFEVFYVGNLVNAVPLENWRDKLVKFLPVWIKNMFKKSSNYLSNSINFSLIKIPLYRLPQEHSVGTKKQQSSFNFLDTHTNDTYPIKPPSILSEEKSSYRQIMKATSLFGGVQVFNIFISLIRSKFIAVLLGPIGMGVAGLLVSTVNVIASITNFGLGISAVKNISEADATGDSTRIATVVAVFKRLVLITGFLGTIATFFLAPFLSKLTFGNADYTLAYRMISVILLLGQIGSGQLVILQGMRKLQYLAKANMAGSLIGLLVSFPVYYYWGIKGIVPAIIITSIFTLGISYYFSSKIKLIKVKLTQQVIKTEGIDMLRMGFILSLSGLIGIFSAYILGIYIGRYGGLDQLGLYNAGFTIVNTYVGMIFTAMATDYFPRLSSVSGDNKKSSAMINQQASVSILIISPILLIFMVFSNIILIVLYSAKFLPINEMIEWVALGIFLKTVTWAMGFNIIAKGDSKIFFYSELFANIYLLAFNILFYRLYGLEGLGMSFILSYILSVFQNYFIIRIRYKFTFDPAFYRIFIIQFLLACSCFILIRFFTGNIRYFICVPLILIAGLFSIIELNKRMGVIEQLKKRLFKK